MCMPLELSIEESEAHTTTGRILYFRRLPNNDRMSSKFAKLEPVDTRNQNS